MIATLLKVIFFVVLVASYPTYLFWQQHAALGHSKPVEVQSLPPAAAVTNEFDFSASQTDKKNDPGCAKEEDLAKTDWKAVKKGLGTGGCSIPAP